MFTTLIVQPIFNLLVLIYAFIPGHNFGLAVVIFTVLARLILWPLVKKQLHQTKAMRKLQPEIKKIKQAAKGNRQKESLMLMELYKERGISPFSSLGPLLLQLPIIIGLYSGLQRVVKDPHNLIDFSYPALQQTAWMQQLAQDIHKFDETLLGVVDLTKSAIGSHGVYWPAMVIVVAAAVTQYFQAKQLQPSSQNAKGLRQILKEASEGKQADQSEMSEAIGRGMRFFIPVMIFLFTVGLASALSLYIFVSGLVAFVQQSIVLNKDEEELEAIADEKTTKKSVRDIPEAEIIENTPKPKTKPKAKTKKSSAKKRKKKRR